MTRFVLDLPRKDDFKGYFALRKRLSWKVKEPIWGGETISLGNERRLWG